MANIIPKGFLPMGFPGSWINVDLIADVSVDKKDPTFSYLTTIYSEVYHIPTDQLKGRWNYGTKN